MQTYTGAAIRPLGLLLLYCQLREDFTRALVLCVAYEKVITLVAGIRCCATPPLVMVASFTHRTKPPARR